MILRMCLGRLLLLARVDDARLAASLAVPTRLHPLLALGCQRLARGGAGSPGADGSPFMLTCGTPTCRQCLAVRARWRLDGDDANSARWSLGHT